MPKHGVDYIWRIVDERLGELPHDPQWSQKAGRRSRVETPPGGSRGTSADARAGKLD
ncbi:hypothetical protein F8B43_1883 [Methylorubrum populi]|uniref:Uncharacterized protein n=1 Tax=Methylorubrum populi TaxID=223967 RepID=A0A833MXM6_9HYPH|nr:hypothetical protein F8B43_1883 [Methylorubrum populi]